MPIEHLQHRNVIPVVGKIKLGVTVPTRDGKNTRPEQTEYFVMPQDLIESFPDKYGQKPKSLDIVFHSEDLNEILDAYYVVFAGRRGDAGGILKRRCDGKVYEEFPESVKEPIRRGACLRPLPQPGATNWPQCECKAEPKGRLRFLLVDGPVGIYEMGIGGHKRLQLLLKDIEMRRSEFGKLAGIPFRLVRKAVTGRAPDADGRLIPKMDYPVRIESFFTLRQALSARGIDPFQLRVAPAALGAAPDDAGRVIDHDPDDPAGDDSFVEDDAVTDDLSMTYRLAADVGVKADDYRVYIAHKYGTDLGGGHRKPTDDDDLAGNSIAIATECAMLREPKSDLARIAVRDRILTKVASIRGGGA